MGKRPGRRWRIAVGVLITFLGSLLMLGGQPAYATTTTIVYSDFSSLSGMVLSGSTAFIGNPVTGPGGQKVLRLTNSLSQAGGAFLNQTVPLEDATHTFQASFSMAFDFQMTHPMGAADENGVGADGIVFVIQTASNQYGGAGGGLGYYGIPKSVGITFDSNTGTYQMDFTPADYGVSPGTQLTVWVYFGDALQGTAQINVQ